MPVFFTLQRLFAEGAGWRVALRCGLARSGPIFDATGWGWHSKTEGSFHKRTARASALPAQRNSSARSRGGGIAGQEAAAHESRFASLPSLSGCVRGQRLRASPAVVGRSSTCPKGIQPFLVASRCLLPFSSLLFPSLPFPSLLFTWQGHRRASQ